MIDPQLESRVVLVTGTNNPYGIGAATAKAFAAQGAAVMLHYFRHYIDVPDDDNPDEPGLAFYFAQQCKTSDETVGAIRAAGGIADSWEGDLADPETVPALFDATEQALGPVDVLVNNAAFDLPDTFVPPDKLSDGNRAGEGQTPIPITAELHDRHFAVNARAVALMMAEYAQRYVGRGATRGRIINTSTDAADCFGAQVSYGASKHALESYSRAAASELGRFGITVNVIAPGPIQTGSYNTEIVEASRRRTPLGRMGTPEDVADVMVFLASEQARWVTGQLLYVGGGHRMPS